MADDELDAGRGELVGDRDALPRIGGIIADGHPDLLLQDAARRIDVGDGLLGAVLELRAERGVLAGEGTGEAELDLRLLRRSLRLRLSRDAERQREGRHQSEARTKPAFDCRSHAPQSIACGSSLRFAPLAPLTGEATGAAWA